MRERYRTIARVAKARGRRGEVVTEPVHGLPSLVREGLEVAVLPPELKGPRWRTVVSASGEGRAGRLVALSGVGDVSSAERLVGRFLLARERDLPEDLALHDPERLVGREVVGEGDGRRARIREVMSGPANDVWVLDVDGGGEVLVPVVDEVVSTVPDEGPIPIRVPRGLGWPGEGGSR